MRTIFSILIPIFVVVWGVLGCTSKEPQVLEAIPAMTWRETQTAPFYTRDQWKNAERDWGMIDAGLRQPLSQPEALETRLLREDREVWREALTHLEVARSERKEALRFANLQRTQAQTCLPPSIELSLKQRSQLRLALQLHRNILWRMGRLEMASRGVSHAIRDFLNKFKSGRIRDAEAVIVLPVMQMVAQIDALRENQPVPRGEWNPGALQFRAARNMHAEAIFVQAETVFESWKTRMEMSERWHYLASTATPVLESLGLWKGEYHALLQAFRAFAAHVQTLERDFAPPHAIVAWPCIHQNLHQLRIITELYSHVAPMQWALTLALQDVQKTADRLRDPEYRAMNPEKLEGEALRFFAQLEGQKARLSRIEDLLLITWDEFNAQIWTGLPDFLDPIHHPTQTVVEDIQTWNTLYREIEGELDALPAPAAEPESQGRRKTPWISSVIETLHAPARIDEAERGLLAISELEAHMISIRDELLRLCKQGACRSFPEAEIAHSPRTNPWVVSWRQNASEERTLGHTLIVIKLCQLHLARLVQRLTEIHAWFSETSNADLSWKKLKTWQRIWTLYAETNGTYANFLRSVAQIDQSIKERAENSPQRAESEALQTLLRIQSRLFDLTLDYARFLDSSGVVPTSFDALITTWEWIDNRLMAIEKATLERDAALHPDRVRTQRSVVDIPR